MLEMVIGAPTPDGDFELRKQVLSFEEFPFFADWPSDRPEAAADFHVAIIGGGFNGIATAVQLEQLGISYTVYERRSELGGTWSIHTYPDIRVDTLSASYEFSFEKNYQWTEYFARGPEVDPLESVAGGQPRQPLEQRQAHPAAAMGGVHVEEAALQQTPLQRRLLAWFKILIRIFRCVSISARVPS
jgi:hypothetical protein